MIFGKHIITKRKVAWYADKPFEYTYSNITKTGLIWTSELIELKELTENLTGETFNSCRQTFITLEKKEWRGTVMVKKI